MRGVLLDRPVARDVVREALQRRLIVNATDERTLRLVPPLIVEAADVDRCLEILGSVLADLG